MRIKVKWSNLIEVNFFTYCFLIFISFYIASCKHTSNSEHHEVDDTAVLPEYIFSSAEDINGQVEQTLALAKSQHKQALIVLGAQWCHDSKGLARNFSTPQMQKLLTKSYQVLFIDVGFLEKGFNVVEQFNIPIYYGTPTVMVIDPNTSKVTNRASMQKWLNADNVPLNEYEYYFSNLITNKPDLSTPAQEMHAYLIIINNFEIEQAKRLKRAYQVIGPLLKQYMESDNKATSDEFATKWEQVRDFRYKVQDDIQALVLQAENNIKSGNNMVLILPTYPEFTWE